MSEITRQILWNIPQPMVVAMYAAVAFSVAVAACGFWIRLRRWLRGEADPDRLSWEERIQNFLGFAVVQQKLLSDPFSAVMHLSIFWGFLGLFITTLIMMVEKYTPLHFLYGRVYEAYSLFGDLSGLLFLFGISLAIIRRYFLRPPNLERRSGDVYVLSLLFLMAFTGFLAEAARIAAKDMPSFEIFSPGGYALAYLFGLVLPPETNWDFLHRSMWIFHVAVVLLFFAAIPWLRFTHILVTPVNVLLKKRPLGALRPVARLGLSPEIGAGKINDFSWKQLMDLDACTGCGRCEKNCPAFNTEKKLSPLKLIGEIRDVLAHDKSGDSSPWKKVEDTEAWNCTTCAACEEACPVLINHLDRIVDLRRHLVHSGKIKGNAPKGLENILYYQNPWGYPPRERTLWARDEKIRILQEKEETDVLYWVGCAGSYDPQGQEVSLAVARLLKKAGVDFAILGDREGCCGDFARRLGEEGLFDKLARQNIETLKKYKFRRILVHCPHGLNVLKNEYPRWGGKYEVIHHSEFFFRLLEEEKLEISSAGEKKIVFHDPCYLGRYNRVFDPPRELLKSIPGVDLRELGKNRAAAFCCGGGGGQIMLDPQYGEGINNKRFEEVLASGAETVATACPYCKLMLDMAITFKNLSGQVRARDIAEILDSVAAGKKT
jgi:Fe-S oxidoreductase/nitrate reductase gamma subunit